MLASELDLALLVERADLLERLHRWSLFSERYVLICPPGHRFQDYDCVSVHDLSEECLLLLEHADCPVRRFLVHILEEQGVKPRRQHFASSQEQILEMVLACLGISLAGDRLPATTTLLRRPIAAEPDRRTVVLSTVAGRQLGPTPALFLKLMRARAWSQGTGPALAAAA
jgi:DNA-binding transcriptional LysR family regulator